MSRTRGARDLKKRKTRKDKGKGKKKYKKYIKIMGKKDSIKLWIWECISMSREGYLRWNRNIRHRIKPEIKKPLRGTIIVPVSEINTRYKFVDFVTNLLLREGDFLVMGFSRAKNKYRVKPVKLCRIRIKCNEYGVSGIMLNDYRLFRYKWIFG